nr:transposase (putative), gypsy type [Tanacetum cinerariifolium]
MDRDTVQLETAVNTISHEYLLEFTSEYGIPKTLHPELPGPEDRIVDFPEGKVGVYNRFFEFANFRFPLSQFLFDVLDERVFPTVVDWRMNAPKDGMPAEGTYSIEAVRALDMHRTPIQKQPEMLLYKANCYLLIAEMDLFNLIRAPNPMKAEETAATDPPAAPESHKKGRDGTDVNAPPKSLRRDHADPRPSGSSHGGKSLAAIQLGLDSTVFVPEDAPAGVSDPDPLSFADAPSRHPVDVAQSFQGIVAAGDPESENASYPAEVGSPGSYNVNLARQVAMGSQLRLRFEQKAKLLRKSVAQVACRDKRIQARELEIKNLEALLETEADMKKAVKDKSDGLIKELEDIRARFSDLQVSNEHLSQQVATLQEQVSGEEKLKAAFEEFKWYEDDRVERRCAKLDARLDALSIDFDEELYPHMLTAIAGRRWVIGHGLRLAVMKCGESLEMRQAFVDVVFAGITKGMSEGLRHGVEHGQAQLNVESIEAY